ncbi:MAG TPA: hypothetical protein DCY48_00650 [Candidatus Magasanikbacteria bacterium]|nr:MAG: hypothetical protein A3I74_02230 [Candidatus Magasanikbacteria bacterium RIFCSPLOWO2_02_FULL_47_16]OGH79673.1 MAG: hypothetical protein A3C10_01170 [Candidatus Magasanikbacteria bacterium RIFCSPHIGHO2_02_FULL_48_18]OGH82460.1 MAG: hypothetical protein A3G08_01190 [Candidatus Magasanikbacteria bacterium RIFCSPLOWO2_12_FULL_47_9b]HAZ28270.1 hypothetical protein [Candidatus Magasanikbacteria bacterium]
MLYYVVTLRNQKSAETGRNALQPIYNIHLEGESRMKCLYLDLIFRVSIVIFLTVKQEVGEVCVTFFMSSLHQESFFVSTGDPALRGLHSPRITVIYESGTTNEPTGSPVEAIVVCRPIAFRLS